MEQAAKTLISYGAVHDARALKILGRRILEVVAPEVAEAWEAEQLEKEEREAEKAAVFRMREDGQGRIKGSFTVPLLVGQMLEKALLDPARLPRAGGVGHPGHQWADLGCDRTPVGVRVRDRPDGAGREEPAARRGPDRAVLHLRPRLVLTMRDGGCTAEGCGRPPAMCHSHHDDLWSHGHGTDARKGRLLCPHHHRRIHDPGYEAVIRPDNQVRFHRRTQGPARFSPGSRRAVVAGAPSCSTNDHAAVVAGAPSCSTSGGALLPARPAVVPVVGRAAKAAQA